MNRSDKQWRYRGSAILFKTPLLAWLLSEPDVVVVPLREALSWLGGMPDALPLSKSGMFPKTILVGGLDPILELSPLAEAENFLRARCRTLIGQAQSRWQEVGLVFGTNIHPDSVHLDHHDHVFMERAAGEKLRLSSSLWNGSAGRDLAELKVTQEALNQNFVEGYYVRRLS